MWLIKNMKSILSFIAITVLNVVLFAVLQIISQFAHFFLFGEGALSDKFVVWVSAFFALLQLMILVLLFRKQVIIKTNALLIVNIILVVGLYIYYALL
jgi:hypothetical protein